MMCLIIVISKYLNGGNLAAKKTEANQKGGVNTLQRACGFYEKPHAEHAKHINQYLKNIF